MNFKKLTVLLSVLALVSILGLTMFGGSKTKAAVGGPVCNVPADYPTIQDAVNDTGCTTINVAAGTYPESVTIGRAVTLKGPNAGVSALAARSPEATVKSRPPTAHLTTSTGVTIDGFTIS